MKEYQEPQRQRITQWWEAAKQDIENTSDPKVIEYEAWLENRLDKPGKFTRPDFIEIWAKALAIVGCGDHEADWEGFHEEWAWIKKGYMPKFDTDRDI